MALKLLIKFQNPGKGPNLTVPYQDKEVVSLVQQGKALKANDEVNTNLKDESKRFHFGKNDNFKNECSDVTEDQKAELLEIHGSNLLIVAEESDGEDYIEEGS